MNFSPQRGIFVEVKLRGNNKSCRRVGTYLPLPTKIKPRLTYQLSHPFEVGPEDMALLPVGRVPGTSSCWRLASHRSLIKTGERKQRKSINVCCHWNRVPWRGYASFPMTLDWQDPEEAEPFIRRMVMTTG
jgi:hypothetical protein